MESEIESQVVEVINAIPKITIKTSLDDSQIPVNETIMRVELPYNCYRVGSVVDYGDDNIWLIGKMTNVPDKLQKNGIGTKLTKSFLDQGKLMGAKRIYVEARSQEGLRLTAKIHGKENLTFHNIVTREVIDKMTYEMALAMGHNLSVGISTSLD